MRRINDRLGNGPNSQGNHRRREKHHSASAIYGLALTTAGRYHGTGPSATENPVARPKIAATAEIRGKRLTMPRCRIRTALETGKLIVSLAVTLSLGALTSRA